MESRKTFEERIDDFTKRDFFLEKKFFVPRWSVKDKVGPTNHFLDYSGDTIVFDLEQKYKDKIYEMVSRLHEQVPECFCDKLDKSTIHLTLHDLSSVGRSINITQDVQDNEKKIKQILNTVKIFPNEIRMKAHFIANILNISLVLVFFPADDEEYLKLLTIYHLFDGVQTLDYEYTPHVTLGYYNINGFDVSSVEKLEKLVNKINKDEFEMFIDTEDLFYQHFTSMNDYKNIFPII